VFVTIGTARKFGTTAVAVEVSGHLPKYPDQHRSDRPILLAVDQQLGEGAALWVAPELADRRRIEDPELVHTTVSDADRRSGRSTPSRRPPTP
jgi:hypothetical protein